MILSILILLLMACATSGNKGKDESELKEQISTLETENAKLAEDESNNSNSFNNSDQDELIKPTSLVDSLPTEPVPAGKPIIYDGWSITVSKELRFNRYNDGFGFTILVRNTRGTDRIFRYTLSSVTVTDNTGMVYELANDSTCEEEYYSTKKLNVDGSDTEQIRSGTVPGNCQMNNGLQLFQGPLPIDAKQLLVHFSDFGPLNGVDVIIDL